MCPCTIPHANVEVRGPQGLTGPGPPPYFNQGLLFVICWILQASQPMSFQGNLLSPPPNLMFRGAIIPNTCYHEFLHSFYMDSKGLNSHQRYQICKKLLPFTHQPSSQPSTFTAFPSVQVIPLCPTQARVCFLDLPVSNESFPHLLYILCRCEEVVSLRPQQGLHVNHLPPKAQMIPWPLT